MSFDVVVNQEASFTSGGQLDSSLTSTLVRSTSNAQQLVAISQHSQDSQHGNSATSCSGTVSYTMDVESVPVEAAPAVERRTTGGEGLIRA